MGKFIEESPPKRDDPIFKEGLTIFTPRSARASTPSTERSPPSTNPRQAPRKPQERPKPPGTLPCRDRGLAAPRTPCGRLDSSPPADGLRKAAEQRFQRIDRQGHG